MNDVIYSIIYHEEEMLMFIITSLKTNNVNKHQIRKNNELTTQVNKRYSTYFKQ